MLIDNSEAWRRRGQVKVNKASLQLREDVVLMEYLLWELDELVEQTEERDAREFEDPEEQNHLKRHE
ncbi:Hypp4572 [Branchiostoma lanceolatum]|uniref:Hypp4572 protein n=1 Tax=Branchiostoma lanceolatum TaxID=7740 RepID=A0A8K0AA93_BRALA|nr:Hypp4572 [Branchiostoma lanceolatum]